MISHLDGKVTVRGVLGAILLFSVLGQEVHGQDWLWSREPRTVLFSGAELGGSVYAGGGFKRALREGLDSTGFVLMGTTGAGYLRDRAVSDTGLSRADYWSNQSSLLAGYQWFIGDSVIALYAGVETDHRQPFIDGVLARRERPRFGTRLQADIWARPSENSLVTASVILGTARPHLWAHHSWGYRIWERVHIGPEATVLLEEDYREARIGLHATGLTIGRYNVRLSGGIMLLEHGEPGGYFTLGTYFRL